MSAHCISTLKDFQSLKNGNMISVAKFGNSGFLIGRIILEPTLSGDIPKILIQPTEKNKQPFFVHFYKNQLVDDNFNAIHEIDENTSIVVN